MDEHDAPLTCTSANLSGRPTLAKPEQILEQFGQQAALIQRVIDDGLRSGQPSTVVKVVGDELEIIRLGSTKLASSA
jgi:tRNA A37 threonylcarbamoyladenosine synthetase subunit TsaC/SUA5/YrdC